MGWRQEKNIFIRKSAKAFIYSVFFFSCANLTRRALLIKCSKKKLYSSKERRGTYCFLMPRLFGVALFRLNAIGYCVFRKSASALVFVRLILRAAFCRGYTVWIVFAGFITFAVNLYYIWVHYCICSQFLLHLWALLHLWSIITFVASTWAPVLSTHLTTDPPTYYRSTHLPSYPNQKEAYLLKQ